MSESRSSSGRSPRLENLVPSSEATADSDSSSSNSSTHAAMADDLTGWKEEDWNRMVELGSDAFARALRESEQAIDAMNPLLQPQNNVIADPITSLSPSAAASLKTVESSAFEQWARRVANLQMLNFEDETRDDPALEFPHPHFDDLMAQARAPVSQSSETPEAQLLRYKVLLAQEEAKNVSLEDRVNRLQHELAACKASNTSLRQTNTALAEKQMQQMANSTGCTQGCGLVRVENERLRKHYATLKQQVDLCEQQLNAVTSQVTNHTTDNAATFHTPSKLPPASPSSDSLPSAPLSPSAALPSALFTSFPTSTTTTDSQQEEGGDASATSALALLRVRCALALARLSLRHQGEMDHLLHYKLHYLSLQNNIDDLESALDTERELREYEREESARNARSLAEAQAAESSAQAVMANMAQQLQKYVGAQGLKVIIAAPSTNQPAAVTSPQSIGSGGSDLDSELFDPSNSNVVSNANTPAVGLSTPHRRSDATTPGSAFPSTVSIQSPTSNAAAVVIGSPSPAPAPASSSGWGLSWILGSGSKEKQAALAAAEQARIIMATQAGSNPPSAKK